MISHNKYVFINPLELIDTPAADPGVSWGSQDPLWVMKGGLRPPVSVANITVKEHIGTSDTSNN